MQLVRTSENKTADVVMCRIILNLEKICYFLVRKMKWRRNSEQIGIRTPVRRYSLYPHTNSIVASRLGK